MQITRKELGDEKRPNTTSINYKGKFENDYSAALVRTLFLDHSELT